MLWGCGLLPSDNEFNVVVSDIDEEACKLAKDPKFTLLNPKNKKQVVQKLNDGLSHELLQLFVRKEWNHGVSSILCLGPSFNLAASSGIRRLLKTLNAKTQ